MSIIGVFTNDGVLKAREAQNNSGFKIYPVQFGVSRTRGALDPNRTTPNSGQWFTATISGRIPVNDNTVKFICTIPVGALAQGTTDVIREIYLYGMDSDNKVFIFAIGQTTTDIVYDPGASVTLELEVSVTNADLNSSLVFQYTQATELAEHESDPNAHAEIISALNKAGLFLRFGGVPFSYAGQTFDEKALFYGTPAVGSRGLLTFKAVYNGAQGNSIVLAFDGVKTADQAVLEWNSANPNNPAILSVGDGSSVPSSGNLKLAGGTLEVGHQTLVYCDTDGYYKPAIADGSIKSRVVGIADVNNRRVNSTGFITYTSGFPVGTELFLSPSNPGRFTDIPSEVKVALVVSPTVILLSSFGGGTATAGQNFDAIVTDVPGFKKFKTTQEAIAAASDGGSIFIDKMESVAYPLDLKNKALSFVFNGPKTGWQKYNGQVEKLNIAFSSAPTSGTWRIEWNGQETADLPYNVSLATIQAAFNGLSGHNGIVVTGSYAAGLSFTFNGNGAYPLPTFFSPGSDETQRVTFSAIPDDGTFRLNVNGQETLNIPWNSTTDEIESWIEGLPNVNDVIVSGSFAQKYFDITFINSDGKQDWSQVSVAKNSLTIGGVPVTSIVSTASQGKYPASNLKINGVPVTISATQIQAGTPIGPDILCEVQNDKTRFLGHGTIKDFSTAFDLKGHKNVDIEVVFENVTLPVINTTGSLKPATEYHRLKSFGIFDRNTIVVGSASIPGDYNSISSAVAAANNGDRILVIADQTITSPLTVNKEIELEFANNARLILGNAIAGTAVTLNGLVRTKHMHVLATQSGNYGKIVEFTGTCGHHVDLYIECSAPAVVDTAFHIAAGASGIFCDGILQIGTATVTNGLVNASGLAHNVQIRDRSNGILLDGFNRLPPTQKQLIGDVDGVNAVFQLPDTPATSGSVLVMVNSLPRYPGVHYDIVGKFVTFRDGSIPVKGQDVFAFYLPTGLITTPPTAKAGSIEALSSGGVTIAEAVKRIKLGQGLSGSLDKNDPFQLNLTSTGSGGSSTDLENIAVNLQPDTNGEHSIGTTTKAWKDVYLKDKSTSAIYRLEIDNGFLQAVEVTTP